MNMRVNEAGENRCPAQINRVLCVAEVGRMQLLLGPRPHFHDKPHGARHGDHDLGQELHREGIEQFPGVDLQESLAFVG